MIFVDEARIFVKGGDGGKGCESFYRDKFMRYPRPDGGDGGRGGNVVFVADRNIQTLLDFKLKQHYKGDKGGNGSSKGKKGKVGDDCLLRVPLGTIIRDEENGLQIKELMTDQQSVIVAKGGNGGRGNGQKQTPTAPKPGEERTIRLELKLVADVGIVGFPNAGKSTLISAISKVRSKIANYPFTTRSPILGIVEHDEGRFVVADLPGIIEGAHTGKGLGHRFLRHAERTKVLIQLIDMAGSEGRDPLDDFEKINHELTEYSDEFLAKKRIIVANKMDLPEAANHLKRFKRKYKIDVIKISSLEKKGLEELINKVHTILCSENSPDNSNESL